MEQLIQDLNTAIPKIQKHFTDYPNASISATYRNLKNLGYLSFFGDYPILSIIVSTISQMEIVIRRNALKRAMRQSKELKGKRILLQQLFNHQMTLRKNFKMSQKPKYNTTLSKASSIDIYRYE